MIFKANNFFHDNLQENQTSLCFEHWCAFCGNDDNFQPTYRETNHMSKVLTLMQWHLNENLLLNVRDWRVTVSSHNNEAIFFTEKI